MLGVKKSLFPFKKISWFACLFFSFIQEERRETGIGRGDDKGLMRFLSALKLRFQLLIILFHTVSSVPHFFTNVSVLCFFSLIFLLNFVIHLHRIYARFNQPEKNVFSRFQGNDSFCF